MWICVNIWNVISPFISIMIAYINDCSTVLTSGRGVHKTTCCFYFKFKTYVHHNGDLFFSRSLLLYSISRIKIKRFTTSSTFCELGAFIIQVSICFVSVWRISVSPARAVSWLRLRRSWSDRSRAVSGAALTWLVAVSPMSRVPNLK